MVSFLNFRRAGKAARAALACVALFAAPACAALGLTSEEDDTSALLLGLAAAATLPQNFTINFAAIDSNGANFACGANFAVSSTAGGAASFRPVDLRFFVSQVKLITASGAEVAATLPDVSGWQTQGAGLLDFETASGLCTGTPETNSQLVVSAPPGAYSGIAFTVGLPYSVNSLQNTAQVAPLNIPAMYWSWTSGYKFMKFEYQNTGDTNKMNYHLGSTGCTGMQSSDCANPFRSNISITTASGFSLTTDRVTLNLSNLLNGVEQNLAANRTCMPAQGTTFCDPLLTSMALNRADGQPTGVQTAFSIVRP